MKRVLVIVGLAVIASLSVLVTPGQVRAADSSRPLNLITSPLPINLQTPPGKSVSTDIKVKQDSGQTERLRVSLMKFAAYGDEGKPRILDRAPGDDYFDWVTFDKTSFDAPNNVWQSVKMTINVPKSAAFGYYYAVVFSREGDDQRRPGNTNAINGGSAVLVLLDAQVAGAKRDVSVAGFTSTHRVYEFLPTEFSVRLKNSGTVHVVPHGNIFIMKGKKQVAALNLNDEQGNILPQSNRIYPVAWTDGFPHWEKVVEDGKVKMTKEGDPVRTLVWSNGPGTPKDFKPHLRMGKYTAHLFAVYDDGSGRDVPVEAELSFWVVPWRLLIGGLVLALLVGAGVFSLTRGASRQLGRIFKGRGGA